MTQLAMAKAGGIQPLHQSIDSIIEALIASQQKKSTRVTYRKNIKYFAHYLLNGFLKKCQKIILGDNQIKEAIAQFLALEKVMAISYLFQYQNDLIEANYTPNSINIRIASIRSLVRFAFKGGFCNWLIEDLKSLDAEVYRDTSGVSKEVFSQIIDKIHTDTVAGKRDYALLRLLWDCGLRRCEISTLSIGDYGRSQSQLKIGGKGKVGKQMIHLAQRTINALDDWLGCYHNPSMESPLFISLANNSRGDRLTGKSIYCIVRKYADKVLGDKILSPHRVRHSSITAVLDASNGNVRMAQKLSRHKSLDVLTRYDDNRVALQKEAVDLLAQMV